MSKDQRILDRQLAEMGEQTCEECGHFTVCRPRYNVKEAASTVQFITGGEYVRSEQLYKDLYRTLGRHCLHFQEEKK